MFDELNSAFDDLNILLDYFNEKEIEIFELQNQLDLTQKPFGEFGV